MSAIDQLFSDLRAKGRTALMPFLTAGDPDLDFTAAVIREIFRRGCHLCEVGIPYSDPLADGPVIQASYTRALTGGVRVNRIFQGLADVTPDLPGPLVTMVSYSIVYRYGPERYIEHARQAGLAGAIVPDLPLEEAPALSQICRREDFSLIQLVTPTTTPERAVQIADTSTGFLYYVSVAGVTGRRKQLPPELIENVTRLREKVHLPVCIGFGIGSPEQVRELREAADGLIVGSALVRYFEQVASQPREQVLREIGDFVQSLVEATRG